MGKRSQVKYEKLCKPSSKGGKNLSPTGVFPKPIEQFQYPSRAYSPPLSERLPNYIRKEFYKRMECVSEGLVVEEIKNQTENKNKTEKDKKTKKSKIMIVIESTDPLGYGIKRGSLVEFS